MTIHVTTLYNYQVVSVLYPGVLIETGNSDSSLVQTSDTVVVIRVMRRVRLNVVGVDDAFRLVCVRARLKDKIRHDAKMLI